MNADEQEIYDFVKSFGDTFVGIAEVSRRLGQRGRFTKDRMWAKPLLLRMEVDGHLESNEYGEFRLKDRSNQTDFLEAVDNALYEASLGDTTIIRLSDVEDSDVRQASFG